MISKISLKHKIIIFIIFLIIISVIAGKIYFAKPVSASSEDTIELKTSAKEEKQTTEKTNYKVDIKGAVASPGVYTADASNIVNDIINMAGGLNSNATTQNLNLSKKIQDEMVIIIYTEEELRNKTSQIDEVCFNNNLDISQCVLNRQSLVVSESSQTDPKFEESSQNNLNETNPQNTKVSLNKATLEELMTLNGIGEAKAKSIIAYREENQGFKSVDELLNVSGIKEALFAKIKDNITL